MVIDVRPGNAFDAGDLPFAPCLRRDITSDPGARAAALKGSDMKLNQAEPAQQRAGREQPQQMDFGAPDQQAGADRQHP